MKMMRSKDFICLCLMATTIIALSSSINLVSGSNPVIIIVDRPVLPFDGEILLPASSEGYEEDYDFAIKKIGPNLFIPSTFESSFSIYTGSSNVTDILYKPLEHCLHVRNTENISCAEYQYNLTQLANSSFDWTKRSIILVAGYWGTNNHTWMQDAKDKWLTLEDVNVVIVQWPRSNRNLYQNAVPYTKFLARQTTIFLYYMAQLKGADFYSEQFRENLQFVGFSLGAHVAGLVGQDLHGDIGRITALDPAGPKFDKLPTQSRLNPSDAKLVDVFHTNSGQFKFLNVGLGLIKKGTSDLLSKLHSKKPDPIKQHQQQPDESSQTTAWLGMDASLGHIDYYVNGGSVQPGCEQMDSLCNHKRSIWLYTNLLDYEIHARNAYGANSSTIKSGMHQLVAFPSPDYDKFKNGINLLRNCPALVMSNGLDLTEKDRYETYKRCTIPIDIVSTSKDLSNRLIDDYDIPLNHYNEEERRFYFDTLSREPFVGEHYLLRMHLESPNQQENPNKWTQGCRLTALMRSFVGEDLFSVVDIRPNVLIPTELGEFYGLTVPFVNPTDWRINFPTQDKIADNFLNSQDDMEVYRHIRYHIPDGISAKITSISSTRPFNRAVNKLSKLSGRSDDNVVSCQLSINALEIRPLSSIVYYMSSWYGLNECQLFPVVKTHRELAKGMRNRSPVTKLNTEQDEASFFLSSIGRGEKLIE